MNFIKYFDVYGKYVTFYYGSSTYHKTTFGGFLSILSFFLMMTITTTSLYNLFYQKPIVNSNIVYFINKKFTQLDAMEISGKIINEKNNQNQLTDFFKNYRIVLYEKYFDEIEQYTVANLKKIGDEDFEFNVKLGISDVFKEKEFSFLKIISCEDLLKNPDTNWPIIDENSNNTFIECNTNYNYFSQYEQNNFYFSFDTPIYTIDRKGNLKKVPHETELHFSLNKNQILSYSLDTKYVVIEDDSNIYYSKKSYDAYFTMKHPVLESENFSHDNKFSLDINIQNKNSDQIILITIYKYKLLEVLAKLGGLMKIITFVKMTCKFWSSYLYEKTLYSLLVKRKNPYFEEKRALIESSVYKKKNKNIENNNIKTVKSDPETSSVRSPTSVNVNYTINNYNYKFNNNNRGPFSLPETDKNSAFYYSGYWPWLLNKFCKLIYTNKDAKRKRLMITDTLGLSNYLLHLDYIDRQIILEQQTGEIYTKIQQVLDRNKEMEENENVEMNLDQEKIRKMDETSEREVGITESVRKIKGLVEGEESHF